MNKLYSLVALVALVVASAPASIANPTEPLEIGGSFLVGEPIGFLLADACIHDRMEGVNSNCVVLEREVDGGHVALTATSANEHFEMSLCWYDAKGDFILCDVHTVPEGAAKVAAVSLGGVAVEWSAIITT